MKREYIVLTVRGTTRVSTSDCPFWLRHRKCGLDSRLECLYGLNAVRPPARCPLRHGATLTVSSKKQTDA